MPFDLFVYDSHENVTSHDFDILLTPGVNPALSITTPITRIYQDKNVEENLRLFHLKAMYKDHLLRYWQSHKDYWQNLCHRIKEGAIFVVGYPCAVLGPVLIDVLNDVRQVIAKELDLL